MDMWSSIDVVTVECLKKFQYGEIILEVVAVPTVGFREQTIYSLGTKKASVWVRDKDNSQTIETNFLVIEIRLVYNVILGRPTLNTIKAILSPSLLLMQFELEDGRVGKLYGDEKVARKCYYVNLHSFWRKEEPAPCESSR